MKVTLYKYENKQIRVDKTNYLQNPLVIDGEVPSANQDMERPTLYFAFTSEPDYNYAYVQEYHRYYYVVNKTWVSGNLWAFVMAVDELYTYRALVRNLSGTVAYSQYGSMRKLDPRLDYNVPPVRSIINFTQTNPNDPNPNPEEPAYGGGIPLIMIRMFASNISPNMAEIIQPSMRIYYLTQYSFQGFLENWMPLMTQSNNAVALAIAASIIDVTRVYYVGDLSGFTKRTGIAFDAPGVLKANSGQQEFVSAIPNGDPEPSANGVYYTDVVSGLLTGCKFNFTIPLTYYWDLTAKHTLFLPFIGTVNLDLKALGLGNQSTANLRVSVVHEPWENAYIINIKNTDSSSIIPYDTATYYTQREVSPVKTTVTFPMDSSFENEDKVAIQKILSTIGSAVATIGMGTMNPAAYANLVSVGANAYGSYLEMEQLHTQSALSYSFQGLTGGSPDYNNVLTYVHIERIATPPANNYTDFWNDHGVTDGAYRYLSAMYGYVQMKEFDMIYDSNATKGEMQRLEQQLYRGVIL